MKVTPLFASLAASSIFTSGLLAQDAPAVDDPEIKLDAGIGGEVDPDKVKLGGAGDINLPDAKPGTAAVEAAPLAAADTKNARKIPESIKKMSEEEKRKLGSLLSDASSYLGGIRVQEAFEKLVEAQMMAPDYAAVHNLLGAAHTKVRDFDKAAASFAKAVEIDPEAFMSRFNLTEIYFVQGKHAEAEKGFKELIALNKDMPESTRALMEFKILICRLKQADEAGAREILKKFDYLDDHPAFYYCNAAIHFNNEEEAEARRWLASAEKIYPRAQLDIYTDSFIEVGWIENLQ